MIVPHRFRNRVGMAALLLTLVTGMASLPAFAGGGDIARAAPVQQLRIYRVHPGNEQAFHDRFRDHALRIMARHGFDVVATWETEAEDHVEFAYLLEWPDAETMQARWDAFMADEEWAAIKRETGQVHGRFVDGIEDRTLRPTPYSPRSRFLPAD
ncbi:NIPSNAP family protein [Marilutibacter chinensis]|uniref:NIPSNAP family protein n=1 Tax=Marilutibacter chinensis TaxID=2912247 RepID=A0ABS9HWY0_9GAMM|nr:NIPSNAP family protein [Lysobacter chinensis]MCF7223386.1 NIPSNAP family protein [Lysobacter chinensis]